MGNTPPCPLASARSMDNMTEPMAALQEFMNRLDSSINDTILKRFKRELDGFDIVLVLDNSLAMQEYWPGVKKTLKDLCYIAGCYDTNGYDLCIVGGQHESKTNFRGEKFGEIDRFLSSMDFYRAPSNLHPAFERLAPCNEAPSEMQRKVSYIVLTADCDQSTYVGMKKLIEKCVKWIQKHKCPKNQIGFQFVQVGSDDKTREFLKGLDDAHLDQDIVDSIQIDVTHPEHLLDAETIVKIFLGGIHRRIDKKGAQGLWHVPSLHRNPLTGSAQASTG